MRASSRSTATSHRSTQITHVARIGFVAERKLPFPEPLLKFNNTAPYVYKNPNNEQPFGDGKKGRKQQRSWIRRIPQGTQNEGRVRGGQREESVYKTDPARAATRVINPASMGGFKPRAPPEGLLVAEGVGRDPVEDPGEDEELPPVALDYGDRRIEYRQRKKQKSRGQTHLESLERFISGGVDGKDHTGFAVTREED